MNQVDGNDWTDQIRSFGPVGEVRIAQCDLRWTQPAFEKIRDEIDLALLELLLHSTDVNVTRYILHDLPSNDPDGTPIDPSYRRSHQEWIRRLACTLAIVNNDLRRPRLIIHRVLRHRSQWPINFDALEFISTGASTESSSEAFADAITSSFGQTPLITAEISLEGPYGDAEPIAYI